MEKQTLRPQGAIDLASLRSSPTIPVSHLLSASSFEKAKAIIEIS